MKFLNRFWPWKRIAELETSLNQERMKCEALQKQIGVFEREHCKVEDTLRERESHIRSLATIIAIKGGFALWILSASLALGQGLVRNNVSTNQLAPGSDNNLLTTAGSVPKWTATILAQVENVSDTAAHLDTNQWPLGVLTWPLDAEMIRIGDGATFGGNSAGVRYLTSITNNPLWADGRPGELMVTTNGLPLSSLAYSRNAQTLWMNGNNTTSTNGTNWIPIMQVLATDLSSNDIALNKAVGTFLIGIDTNGLSSNGGTAGAHGGLNGGIFMVAGAGGDATAAGATGGAGGSLGGSGVVMQFQGGHAGSANANNGFGGNGGRAGQVIANGGNGGSSTNAGVAANGGIAGTLTMNGGNGSQDGTTLSRQGGFGGSITTSGGNAFTDNNGNNFSGGTGGAITTAANGTNAGGSLTMSSPGTTRRGGNLTTFGSSYSPMTIFTTTTLAGPNASAAETSVLGTAAFLASTGQVTGKNMASNVVDHVGRTLLFSVTGSISNNTGKLQLKIKLGTTIIISTDAVALTGSANATNKWRFEGAVTFQSTGSSANTKGNGFFEEFGAGIVNAFATTNLTTIAIDTTTDEAIDCTATFASGDGQMFGETAVFRLED